MPHPLVTQLRFARQEFRRALAGLSEDDTQRRIAPMNCISWNIGHLAWHEQQSWLLRGQGQLLLPELQQQYAYGAAASTPALASVWDSWQRITAAADPWLDQQQTADLQRPAIIDGQPSIYCFGTLLQRVIYHYWYHTGESMAIRQLLGHAELPEFVGDIDHEAPYRPDIQPA